MSHTAPCLGLALLLVAPLPAIAQLPTTHLDSLFPPAAQAGRGQDVRIEGHDLDEVDRLVFSHPGIQAKAAAAPQGEFGEAWLPAYQNYHVEVAADVPPGRYEVRAIGRYGASNPRSLYVSAAPVVIEPASPHHQPDQAAPLAIGSLQLGRCEPAQIDWYTLRADGNGPMTIRCDAAIVDSPMRPAIVVLGRHRRELDRVFHPDAATVTFTVAADAEYWVGVYDQVYRGGADFLYRLVATPSPRLIASFPPVVTVGGSICPKLLVETSTDRRHDHWDWIDLPGGCSPPAADLQPASWQVPSFGSLTRRLWADPLTAGQRPIALAETALPVETEPLETILAADRDTSAGDGPQTIQVPCEVAGLYYPHADLDTYEFTAAKGDVLAIDVFSHRLGCPTRPQMVIERIEGEKAQRIALVNQSPLEGIDIRGMPIDPRHRDPRYRLEVPEDGIYRVSVRDLFSEARDDPALVYRIRVAPPQPDLALVAWFHEADPQNDRRFPDRAPALRSGQSLVLTVVADRRDGMESPVEISVEGLPPQMHAPPALLPPGQNLARLVITAGEGNEPWSGPVRVVGRAQAGGEEIERLSTFATTLQSTDDINSIRPAARLCHDLVLSFITCEPIPVTVRLGDETSGSEPLAAEPGKELEIPVRITRSETFAAPVDLAVRGLPEGARADNLQIAPDASEAVVRVKWEKRDLPPGPYTVYLEGKTAGKYSRNQDAVQELRTRKSDFQKTLDQLRGQAAEGAEAAEKLKRAEAFAQQLDAQLKSVEDQNKTVDVTIPLVSNALRILAPPAPRKE